MILPYWPEPELPAYKAGRFGKWRAQRTPIVRRVPGYFTFPVNQSPGWMFKRQNEIWMSLSRMEIESHMPHIAAACGHTVIAGLGMGFVLYNIMRKPEVTNVTVIEKDREVVTLMDKVTDWRKWPGHEKVKVVNCDATEYVPNYTPNEYVDFLYVDIWESLGSYKALGLTQQIQERVGAASVGWWGQEFDFVSHCMALGIRHADIGRKAYREFARAEGLPLIEQNSRIYPRLALLAVMLQTALSLKDATQKRIITMAARSLILEEDEIDSAIYG